VVVDLWQGGSVVVVVVVVVVVFGRGGQGDPVVV